jgi:curved DNA-binding protein CbpA
VPDPYRTLGVDPSVSDADLHAAYRRLVKAAHPDRNGGTAEATRRFVEIQAAYEQVTAQRKQTRPASGPRPPAGDPAVEARLADLELQVREAQAARERAAQAARDALREVQGEEEIHLPSDDEDSFSKLLADAAAELRSRIEGAREHPTVKRATEMIAGLDWLASTLDGKHSGKRHDESHGDERDDESRGDESGGGERRRG